MMSRRNLNARLEALKSKGVRLEQAFVQADIKQLGKLVSAESEITVAELVGERLGDWGGITIHPLCESHVDVDLDIKDQGTQFSVQVKTFEFLTSKYGRRMSDATKDWFSTLPEGKSGYVAQRYHGADLVSEVVTPIKGVARPAHAGTIYVGARLTSHGQEGSRQYYRSADAASSSSGHTRGGLRRASLLH